MKLFRVSYRTNKSGDWDEWTNEVFDLEDKRDKKAEGLHHSLSFNSSKGGYNYELKKDSYDWNR